MSVPFNVENHEDLLKDYRDDVPGDSYGDSWPMFYNDPKNFIGLAIHHTAGPDTQSVDSIANFHIAIRKWGGIGYHFVVDREGKIWYVGDLGTGRVHVAGLNDKYIGICMIGSFMEDREPTDAQLQSVHLLCKEFIDNEPERFPSLDNWDDVRYHKELYPTACPGDTRPEWWAEILYGVDNGGVDDESCEDMVIRLKKDVVRITGERNRKDQKFEVAKLLATSFEDKYNREIDLHKLTSDDRTKWLKAYEKVVNEEIAPLKIALQKAKNNVERLLDQKYTVKESLNYLFDAIIKRTTGGDKE